MKVLICFEGSSEPLEVPPDQTVEAMKQMVKKYFLVQLSKDNQVQQYLELSFGGAALQDAWALCDVGIKSGSSIQCLIKTEQRPLVNIFNAVTGQILPIMGGEALLHTSVATLKTLVSKQSSLPVSTFRLSTRDGVELYDCNQLQDYEIQVGTTLHLDTWDGWVEFLRACLLGQKLTVQSCLSENSTVMRFQLQVALYIAASLGHLDLASWITERGMHADQPVGVHPYRHWCHQTAHRDSRKCPIHMAAERGQLLILKLFITNNPLTLACQDPDSRSPLKVSVQCGHRECARYLVNKLYSAVSFARMFLSLHLYLQIKRWVSLGRRRVTSNQGLFTGAPSKRKEGDKVLVDGFNRPKMSSQSWKSRRGSKTKLSQLLPTNRNLFSVSSLVSKKSPSHVLGPGIREGESRSIRGKCILPPISRETFPSLMFACPSLKSSNNLRASLETHHCGRTPRENAIYYLTAASTFTEKPWLKQLKIARTLIRKQVHSMS